jgi:hypothetical protein
VEDLLSKDEKIRIIKRKRVIVRSVREKSTILARRPDFLTRLNSLYRGKRMKVNGAEIIAWERSR